MPDISSKDFEKVAAAYAAARSLGDPVAVASFFALEGSIVINDGDPIEGRDAIAGMAQGFYDEFPGLVVHCNSARLAGAHALFAWTLEGEHSETGNAVKVAGWEEWDLNEAGEVQRSRGWFDAADCDRQVQGG
jgi:uncharacterized protein (TIGR02246 family)